MDSQNSSSIWAPRAEDAIDRNGECIFTESPAMELWHAHEIIITALAR